MASANVTSQTTAGEQGPQSPGAERQDKIANRSGVAYEVYSVTSGGQKKRHQVWEDRGKAYDQLTRLRKLYGKDIQAGIREVRDVKGDLFSQSVKKCQALLNKAAPDGWKEAGLGGSRIERTVAGHAHTISGTHKGPKLTIVHQGKTLHAKVYKDHHAALAASDAFHKTAKAMPHMPPVTGKKVGGIVTGGGKVMTGKSPKVTGKVSTSVQLGTTKSGKAIHNDPGHANHASFSSADHMDAYRTHAAHLSRLDAKETHPSIIEHHKQALNTHYKMGTSGMKKSFSDVVADCRSLIKGEAPLGKTKSGKEVHAKGGSGSSASWTKHDHMDAMVMHQQAHHRHSETMQGMVHANKTTHYAAPDKVPGFKQVAGKALHHAKMSEHHAKMATKLGASSHELWNHKV